MRRTIGFVLCLIAPAWLAFAQLHEHLFDAGILNTKDLAPLIGTEKGTMTEYLLNVWHWDGLHLLLMLASLPCLAIGIGIIWYHGWSTSRSQLGGTR